MPIWIPFLDTYIINYNPVTLPLSMTSEAVLKGECVFSFFGHGECSYPELSHPIPYTYQTIL